MNARYLIGAIAIASLFACAHRTVRMPASVPKNLPILNKTADDYNSYIDGYTKPEYFQDNNMALNARLKLIDQVPAGGEINYMTFVFDNGYASKQLAAHLCAAAKRGAVVKLFPDSKSGDRIGVPDVFDGNIGNQINEEIYQVLANCGVEVRIHNHIEEFSHSIINGHPLPKFPKTWTGSSTGFVANYTAGWIWNSSEAVTERATVVGQMGDRLLQLLQESFGSDKVKDFAPDKAAIQKMKSMIKDLAYNLAKEAWSNRDPEYLAAFILEYVMTTVEKEGVPGWSKEQVAKYAATMQDMIWGFLAKLQNDDFLGPFYAEARKFNRLNHRKLFYVAFAGRSCMMLGGRNVGDHYLTWGRHGDEWIDSDVLLCNHHTKVRSKENALQQAKNSFDELWDNKDDFDALKVKPVVTNYKRNVDYKFRYVKFPSDERRASKFVWLYAPVDPATGQYVNVDLFGTNLDRSVKVEDEERDLHDLITWKDQSPIHGLQLEDTFNWRVVTATWNTKFDIVRQRLYDAISREKQHIYIETAYSEMNTEFRKRLERALRNGVKVDIVTNSIYVADGGSKGIRLMMARWFRQMWLKYPHTFSARYSTLEYGHMIHFKGASFQCQQTDVGVNPRAYRLNIVGSHNFHGRSGYSDKEHAVVWEQPPRQDCLLQTRMRGQTSEAPSLRDIRDEFWRDLSAKAAPLRPLIAYKSLADEVEGAIDSGKLTGMRASIANKMIRLLYKTTEEGGKLRVLRDADGNVMMRAQDSVFFFLQFLSESGLSDMFGALL